MRIPLRITPRAAALACAFSLAFAAPAGLRAQSAAAGPETRALYDELARMDSILFDAAFVSCDLARITSMFTDDVEFYHDVTGAKAGKGVVDDFARLTRNCPRAQGVTRELVPGSLQVYPMNNYGAVQMGAHHFVQANGEPSAVALFVHLWRRVDGEWKLARVLSYDHRPDAPAASSPED